MGQRIERYFWKEKEKLLDIENRTQQLDEILNLYRQILSSVLQYLLLDPEDKFFDKKTNIFTDTKDVTLSSSWM